MGLVLQRVPFEGSSSVLWHLGRCNATKGSAGWAEPPNPLHDRLVDQTDVTAQPVVQWAQWSEGKQGHGRESRLAAPHLMSVLKVGAERSDVACDSACMCRSGSLERGAGRGTGNTLLHV